MQIQQALDKVNAILKRYQQKQIEYYPGAMSFNNSENNIEDCWYVASLKETDLIFLALLRKCARMRAQDSLYFRRWTDNNWAFVLRQTELCEDNFVQKFLCKLEQVALKKWQPRLSVQLIESHKTVRQGLLNDILYLCKSHYDLSFKIEAHSLTLIFKDQVDLERFVQIVMHLLIQSVRQYGDSLDNIEALSYQLAQHLKDLTYPLMIKLSELPVIRLLQIRDGLLVKESPLLNLHKICNKIGDKKASLFESYFNLYHQVWRGTNMPNISVRSEQSLSPTSVTEVVSQKDSLTIFSIYTNKKTMFSQDNINENSIASVC